MDKTDSTTGKPILDALLNASESLATTAAPPEKSARDTIKLVRKAFDALYDLDNIDCTHHREKLLSMCKEEEKSHRGWGPDFTKHHTSDTASVSDAAKLFAVKRVAEYMTGQDMPKGKDFLHIQKSCFYAAGLVDEFRDRIDLAWSKAGLDINELNELDYCKVVKVRKDGQ